MLTFFRINRKVVSHFLCIARFNNLFSVFYYGDQIFTCGPIEGCETSIAQVTRRCSFTSTLYFIFFKFKTQFTV